MSSRPARVFRPTGGLMKTKLSWLEVNVEKRKAKIRELEKEVRDSETEMKRLRKAINAYQSRKKGA